MTRNDLFICWHLGLGDIIICAPIVRLLAPVHEMVVIPAKHHNVPSVNYLFRDLPNVIIRGVCDDQEMLMFRDEVWKRKTLNLGCFGNGFNGQEWDISFYRQAGIEFNDRWNHWKCERDLQAEAFVSKQSMAEQLPGKKIFIHADRERGILVRTMSIPDDGTRIIPSAGISPILFHWRTVIECCDEIHCISSSFAAFIDSIDLLKKPKLVLHAYARAGEPLCQYNKNWEILK